jgi:hypothetical protein
LETSALNGTNIDKGFEMMIRGNFILNLEIYDRFKILVSEEEKRDSIELGQKIKLEDISIEKKPKKKKCCK